MAFTHTFDTAAPDGGDDPAEADNNMRRIQAAVQEREDVDHHWPLTGTEVSDASTGEHKKVTLRVGSAPTAVADKGFVYAKDVSNKAELFYRDEDGNEVQLTSVGKILSASLDMKDEDDMASDSATHAATQQSIKAYADAVAAATAAAIAAKAFTELTNLDDESNAMVVAHAYLANQDGDVFVVCTTGALSQDTICYKDSDSNPASGGTIMTRFKKDRNVDAGEAYSLFFNIKSGEYFEITSTGTSSVAIYWRGRGSALVEPTDQD